MRVAYDLSPLYPSMIGADHMAGLLESAARGAAACNDPPYDIEKIGEHAYRISLATAGFREDQLEVTVQANLLVVRGRKPGEDRRAGLLHQGLTQRAFEHRFELADHVVVRQARYENGLLTIDLARETPEALRPRRIEINGRAAGGLSRLMERKRRARKAA